MFEVIAATKKYVINELLAKVGILGKQ